MWHTLFVDVNLATMTPNGNSFGAIADGALAVTGHEISYVGPRSDLPGRPEVLSESVIECDGSWMTPGLIDCHTHLVFGGNRAGEFEQRLRGVSYETIARQGGGILSTVRATREATAPELLRSALRRLDDLRREGVTVVEVKSGYGLETAAEVKMLEVARRLAVERPVDIRTTFLGAHAVPPEFHGRQDAYVEQVCEDMIPAVTDRGLADAVDAFCENIAFSPAQTARVFDTAARAGVPVKLHADQLSDQGGAALAAGYGGLSADHLEYVSEDGVRSMASSGTVAVLLPGAFYTLRESRVPPIGLFRKYGVPIALSTDCNPGTSPVTSLLLMVNMGCTLFRLTIEEALLAVTVNGARALGMATTHGTLEVGKAADLVMWDIDSPADLAYSIGANPCRRVVKGGTEVPFG